MKLNALNKAFSGLPPTERMPVVFAGHGNPMNAIEENEFVQGWRRLADDLPRPRAILCISAHWETQGTFVTAMKKPRTIHDFGGFPRALFEVQYPAPGDPELATSTANLISGTKVGMDDDWGLDHGCWSVVMRMYPKADIPVIQLSLDRTQGPAWHFDLASQLSDLRSKGVLILGSGNIVHNLGLVDWRNPASGHDWALEASEGFNRMILEGSFDTLIQYRNLPKAYQLAVPTPDHYLPLLYTLGLKGDKEQVKLFNDKTVMGSISMTSVRIG